MALTEIMTRRRRISFRPQTCRSARAWSRPCIIQVSELSILRSLSLNSCRFKPRGLAPAQAYIGFEILVLAFTTLHHGWNPYPQSLISLSSG